MQPRALVFDIGGTVFDWSSAILETLDRVAPAAGLDREAFAYACREQFLAMNAAVIRKEIPWMTADEMLVEIMNGLCEERGLADLTEEGRIDLARSWRRMPAWPGAREAIAALRKRYIALPLTILSFNMAAGSSRRNGIDWDTILSCDILGVYKPDPRCFARTIEILGCAADEIMMVAAHPSDLRAARQAGFRAAYVLPRLHDPGEDYTDRGLAGEFDIVASDFADLAGRLGA